MSKLIPNVETQWSPQRDSSCEEMEAIEKADKLEQSHPMRVRNLLSALSFESRPSTDVATRHQNNYSKKRFPRKKWKRVIRKPTLPFPAGSANLTHGLRVDSEGSDVYFDAEEYGDLAQDSFRLRGPARESVVLADVKVSFINGAAVETVLVGDSAAVVENGNARVCVHEDDHYHQSGSEDEEFEYSEQEYNSQCESGDDRDYFGHGASDDSSNRAEIVLSSLSISDETRTFDGPASGPPPPTSLPLRFLRAGKNDPIEGARRYEATLAMRKENNIDTILREASPDFELIKNNYPHFCHMTGKLGEPVFYEQPPKTNLKALRGGGVTLDKLLHHYIMIAEYQWQYLERDDLATSIYVIDLEGMRMGDFVGETVDFVKRASGISAQHYPERAGYVFVINVPGWFKMVWNVIKPIVDEDTQKKIYILRGKEEIRTKMQERIAIDSLPPEYGGKSMPLGESPEEKQLAALVQHNNDLAKRGLRMCENDCKFCSWRPARSY